MFPCTESAGRAVRRNPIHWGTPSPFGSSSNFWPLSFSMVTFGMAVSVEPPLTALIRTRKKRFCGMRAVAPSPSGAEEVLRNDRQHFFGRLVGFERAGVPRHSNSALSADGKAGGLPYETKARGPEARATGGTDLSKIKQLFAEGHLPDLLRLH